MAFWEKKYLNEVVRLLGANGEFPIYGASFGVIDDVYRSYAGFMIRIELQGQSAAIDITTNGKEWIGVLLLWRGSEYSPIHENNATFLDLKVTASGKKLAKAIRELYVEYSNVIYSSTEAVQAEPQPAETELENDTDELSQSQQDFVKLLKDTQATIDAWQINNIVLWIPDMDQGLPEWDYRIAIDVEDTPVSGVDLLDAEWQVVRDFDSTPESLGCLASLGSDGLALLCAREIFVAVRGWMTDPDGGDDYWLTDNDYRAPILEFVNHASADKSRQELMEYAVGIRQDLAARESSAS